MSAAEIQSALLAKVLYEAYRDRVAHDTGQAPPDWNDLPDRAGGKGLWAGVSGAARRFLFRLTDNDIVDLHKTHEELRMSTDSPDAVTHHRLENRQRVMLWRGGRVTLFLGELTTEGAFVPADDGVYGKADTERRVDVPAEQAPLVPYRTHQGGGTTLVYVSGQGGLKPVEVYDPPREVIARIRAASGKPGDEDGVELHPVQWPGSTLKIPVWQVFSVWAPCALPDLLTAQASKP